MSCPACFQGAVRTDKTPAGKVEKVYGRDCYTAEPPGGQQPKGIIVIVPDAFGWEFPNNRLLADEYAQQGNFRVYLPDFMDGKAAPPYLIDQLDYVMLDKSISGYLWKPYHLFWTLYAGLFFMFQNGIAVSMPKVNDFLAAIRHNDSPSEALLPIGVAGFCWGGQHVVRLGLPTATTTSPHSTSTTDASSSDSPVTIPLADALFTAHMSRVKVPADIVGITVPISFALGDRDIVTTVDDVRKAGEILEKAGTKHEEVIYEGAGHGWSVRIDRSNEKQKIQAEECERQAVGWFTKIFGEVKR